MSINNQNTRIAADVQKTLDNTSKLWEDKQANEGDRLAHYKVAEDDKGFLIAFLAKYRAEHGDWLQKHTKDQQTFYTIKKEDRLLNHIISAILDEWPTIELGALNDCLRYEDGKVIPPDSIYDARKRWNSSRRNMES